MEYGPVIGRCPLFQGLEKNHLQYILDQHEMRVVKYSRGELIAQEGGSISHLGILLSGGINVEKLYMTGKVIQVRKLQEGDLFGHVSVFSDFNSYPCNIIADQDAEVLIIPKEQVVEMCAEHKEIMVNMLRIISNQTYFLSKRLKFISYDTIRKKLADYILEEYRAQNKMRIDVPISRKEMAEGFGVTRPALSKELMLLKQEGILDYGRNYIEINQLEKIMDVLA